MPNSSQLDPNPTLINTGYKNTPNYDYNRPPGGNTEGRPNPYPNGKPPEGTPEVLGPDGKPIKNGATEDAAHKWLREVIRAQPDKYDTGISDDVWLSWYPQWDDSKKLFKSQNVDANGKPFTGDNAYADKPTDCPPNTQAWGDSQCLPTGDRRLLQGNPSATAAAPAAAATASTSGAPGEIAYTGNPMVDMLIYQFNNRRSLATGQQGYSNLFGMDEGRNPVAGTDSYGAPLGQPAITGKLLNGGGLWWGDANADLSGALSYGQAPPPVAGAATNGGGAAAAAGGGGGADTGWNTFPIPKGLGDVNGGTVTKPIVQPFDNMAITQSPLQKMLLGNQRQGAFGGLFT